MLIGDLLANLAKLNRFLLQLAEQGCLSQLNIDIAALLVEVSNLAGKDQPIERPMQDSIDPETMNAHGLHSGAACLLILLRVTITVWVLTLIWIENNCLSLLMRHNLAHSAILGERSETLLHFLNDAELLAL